MYVEISPRQSGKTSRLISAAIDFLLSRPYNLMPHIAVCTFDARVTESLKDKFRQKLEIAYGDGLLSMGDHTSWIAVVDHYMSHIKFMSGNLLGAYRIEPDYWFFDEFAYIRRINILHPINRAVIENAYYCTSPEPTNRETTDFIVDYCREIGTEIQFINPWSERRIIDEAFPRYVRDTILNDWVSYMCDRGFNVGAITTNFITKHIKRHNFIHARKRF